MFPKEVVSPRHVSAGAGCLRLELELLDQGTVDTMVVMSAEVIRQSEGSSGAELRRWLIEHDVCRGSHCGCCVV